MSIKITKSPIKEKIVAERQAQLAEETQKIRRIMLGNAREKSCELLKS